MIQILNLLPIVMMALATGVDATARYSDFFQGNNCTTDGSKGFKMGNTGCFNVGHALSYRTGNRDEPGQAPSGEWCLVKYRDDTCDCIDDYEVLTLTQLGVDDMCHTLAPDPYHGSYHWAKIGNDGLCPVSGCYTTPGREVSKELPDRNKISPGYKIVNEPDNSLGYVGVIAKRRMKAD